MLKTAALSAEALANVLDQSVDCVKLIGLDGSVLWMNTNGLCAMEIDAFANVRGRRWHDLWPEGTRTMIGDAIAAASKGETFRFDAFCPTAKGSPRWWNVTVSSVAGVDGEPAGYLAISRDITEAETHRRALLVTAEEMRHRLRNTYAMIGSLLRGFARGNDAHEQFAKDMQSRLISLSAAQSLFSANDVPCEIGILIPALIEPFATPTCNVSTTRIADVSVPQGQADAIALVLSELAVNSAKHGALCGGGTVQLSADAEDGGLSIIWSEQSLMPVVAHTRDGGQGLKLIERIVQARGGTIDIAWGEHGLTVTVAFPHGSSGQA